MSTADIARVGVEASADSPRPPRFPVKLDYFAIPLGVSALGGAWTAAGIEIPALSVVADVLELIALALWFSMTTLYAVQVVASRRGAGDMHHPASGPFVAYVPVIGILLASHFSPLAPDLFRIFIIVFVSLLAVVDGLLIRYWLVSDISVEALHPGYFLPVVAGPFIASVGLSGVGLRGAGWALFGIGGFFWVTIGAIVLSRLITGSRLPNAALPALSILMAPPSTAALAWLAATAGAGPVGVLDGLLGVLALMFIAQVALIPTYVKVPFSLTFWAFTFPVCAAANLVIRLVLARLDGPLELPVTVVILVVSTALVVGVASASISWAAGRRPARTEKM